MSRNSSILLVLVLSLAIVSGVASAQEAGTSTPAPTTTASGEDPAGTRFYGDDDVRITSWSYEDGTFTISFYSDLEKQLTLTAEPSGSGRGASPGNVKQVWIREGKTTVTIEAPTGTVWLSTLTSVANGRYTELSASKESHLLAGPYTASDVRDAGIGAALGVALAVLYEATAAKVGTTERGERMA